MENVHITGITDNLQEESHNVVVLQTVKDLLPEGVVMDVVSFSDVPVYDDSDFDALNTKQLPEPVIQFKAALENGDALIIASPDYYFDTQNGLKNAIDWITHGGKSSLLNKPKPAVLLGAIPSKFGTLRIQMAFLTLYMYMNMAPIYRPQVSISDISNEIDEEGKLIDENIKELISKKLAALRVA